MEEKRVDYFKASETAIKSASGMLLGLQSRHSKAKEYYSQLIELSKGGVTEQLYNTITKELKRYIQTKKKFNEERSPITNVLADLAKPFIDIENDFDPKKEGSMAAELKKIADNYATKKSESDKLLTDKLAKQTARTKEMERVSAEADLFLKKKLLAAKEAIMIGIDTTLNMASLENLGDAKKIIMDTDLSLPPLLFEGFSDGVEVFLLGVDEVITLFNESKKTDSYRKAIIDFNDALVVYQHDAVAKIPAIKEELELIESAAPKEAGDLKKDRDRRIKADVEFKSKEVRKEQELLNNELTNKEELGNIQSEFELGAQAAVVVEAGVRKKEKWKIDLIYPAGIAEVCKFWIEKGNPSDPVKANKMTIGRMILYAERYANNHGVKIVSDYVNYKTEVTAKI